jgi:hypothetical protein
MRLGKLPVHVSSHQSGPSVSDNDSIRVAHGNDFENQTFAEFARHAGSRYEKADQAMNDPRGCGFSRMKPPLNIDDPLLLPFRVVEIRDSQHGDINPAQGLAEDLVLEVATAPTRGLRAVWVVRVETF